jgi:putative membrane protein insertion efficiency factor
VIGSRVVISILRVMHRGYKLTLSPLIGQECRFYPTCSDYALEAVERRGVIRGLGLAIYRVLRCNPWGGSGFDPVPTGLTNIKEEVLDGR